MKNGHIGSEDLHRKLMRRLRAIEQLFDDPCITLVVRVETSEGVGANVVIGNDELGQAIEALKITQGQRIFAEAVKSGEGAVN